MKYNGMKLDMSAAALRDLMTEQCKTPTGWATYYTGTRAEMLAAGIPENLLGSQSAPVEFRANGQECAIGCEGTNYELTIHWHDKSPWYHSAGHPALAEIGRMCRINNRSWLTDPIGLREDDKAEVNVERLCDDPMACDYRLPRYKRFALNPEIRQKLFVIENELAYLWNSAEIFAIDTTPTRAGSSADCNVIPLVRRKG
jgi:hypothetical protein